MYLKYNKLWREMYKKTGRDIEKPAIFELMIFIENQIDIIISQSVKEFNKINQMRIVQGLYQKKRIDRDCIVSAIKHLCSKDYLQEQNYKGGNNKIGVINVKHKPKGDNQGVEFY